MNTIRYILLGTIFAALGGALEACCCSSKQATIVAREFKTVDDLKHELSEFPGNKYDKHFDFLDDELANERVKSWNPAERKEYLNTLYESESALRAFCDMAVSLKEIHTKVQGEIRLVRNLMLQIRLRVLPENRQPAAVYKEIQARLQSLALEKNSHSNAPVRAQACYMYIDMLLKKIGDLATLGGDLNERMKEAKAIASRKDIVELWLQHLDNPRHQEALNTALVEKLKLRNIVFKTDTVASSASSPSSLAELKSRRQTMVVGTATAAARTQTTASTQAETKDENYQKLVKEAATFHTSIAQKKEISRDEYRQADVYRLRLREAALALAQQFTWDSTSFHWGSDDNIPLCMLYLDIRRWMLSLAVAEITYYVTGIKKVETGDVIRDDLKVVQDVYNSALETVNFIDTMKTTEKRITAHLKGVKKAVAQCSKALKAIKKDLEAVLKKSVEGKPVTSPQQSPSSQVSVAKASGAGVTVTSSSPPSSSTELKAQKAASPTAVGTAMAAASLAETQTTSTLLQTPTAAAGRRPSSSAGRPITPQGSPRVTVTAATLVAQGSSTSSSGSSAGSQTGKTTLLAPVNTQRRGSSAGRRTSQPEQEQPKRPAPKRGTLVN